MQAGTEQSIIDMKHDRLADEQGSFSQWRRAVQPTFETDLSLSHMGRLGRTDRLLTVGYNPE